MITLHNHKNAAAVITYFQDSFTDYYGADHRNTSNAPPATWHGITAQLLGLSDTLDLKSFKRISRNLHPLTGAKLTPHTKAKRRIAVDMTFHVPKSVSLLRALTEDPDISRATDEAVALTMTEVETHAQTRIRKSNAQENRLTANLLYAMFSHDTARPVNGVSDPHDHRHCLIFNLTYDATEQRFKALQNETLFRNKKYYQALFLNHLAALLTAKGYAIEPDRQSFKIKGLNKPLTDKFSNRTKIINARAEELSITDPKAKHELGSKTREKKTAPLSPAVQQNIWKARLSLADKFRIYNAKQSSHEDANARTETYTTANDNTPQNAAIQAIKDALEHLLERCSVIDEQTLLTHALYYAMGTATLSDLQTALSSYHELITRRIDGQNQYTTQTRLADERETLILATSGKNQYAPIAPAYVPQNDRLTHEQAYGVKQALSSTDFLTVLIGDAGTGKTYTVKEIETACNAANIPMAALAPTAAASRGVQRADGFTHADTLAKFLSNKAMQQTYKNGLLWVDEAGLLSLPQTLKLLKIAKDINCRILISGDTKQHGSVEHTDTLRLLMERTSIPSARLTKVFRQTVLPYRKAVETIATGNVSLGFNALSDLGAIHEHEDTQSAINEAAKDFLTSDEENTLLVSPTHKQGQKITALIRKYRKATGQITGSGHKVNTLVPVDRTNRQKQDQATYQAGQIIEFHANVSGIKAKSRFTVLGKDQDGHIRICDAQGITRTLPLSQSAHFSVFEPKPIELATGDKIRITQNTRSTEGIPINNGATLTLTGFDEYGRMQVTNGKQALTLPKYFAHLAYGYYTTSPASQGRTVEKSDIAGHLHQWPRCFA